MTEATKTNYTEAQTLELVNEYKAGVSVEQLAERLGKSVRSVVAKLSREGVYTPKAKARGVARVRKAELVERLATACSVPAELFESLEKANHEVLEHLVAQLGA